MRKIIKILVLSSLTIIGLSPSIFGATLTKTFEIGEGTSQPFSHRRTFEVPCITNVSGQVFFSRSGRPGTERDVPLTITLMQPAIDGGEGEVVETKQATANTSLNSVSFSKKRSPLGCQKTWSVRVKAAESSSNFTVKGEIRLSFYSGENFFHNFNKWDVLDVNQSRDFPIVFREGELANENPQGKIELWGGWDHNLRILPVKLRFQLINPRGESVAEASGYSIIEMNPCCSGQKLKLIYRFPENIPGVWTLRIKNIDNHIAVDIRPYGLYKSYCQ